MNRRETDEDADEETDKVSDAKDGVMHIEMSDQHSDFRACDSMADGYRSARRLKTD